MQVVYITKSAGESQFDSGFHVFCLAHLGSK